MNSSEIVERLRRERPEHKRVNGKTVTAYFPVNPDGPEAASHIEAQDKLLSDMEEVLTMLTSAAVLIPEMNGKECSVPRLHIEWAEKVLSEALSKKDTQ